MDAKGFRLYCSTLHLRTLPPPHYLLSCHCLATVQCQSQNHCPAHLPHFYYPIYNGAKPEYPCSVFLAVFCDAKTASFLIQHFGLPPFDSAMMRKQPHATPLRRQSEKCRCGSHVFRITTPSLPKVAKEREVAVQRNAMICIEAHCTDVCNWRS